MTVVCIYVLHALARDAQLPGVPCREFRPRQRSSTGNSTTVAKADTGLKIKITGLWVTGPAGLGQESDQQVGSVLDVLEPVV